MTWLWESISKAKIRLTVHLRLFIHIRMEFEDFCRFFTDVVVCRLVEQSLLWPTSHWREVRCRGEWKLAPEEPPRGAIPHSGEARPGDRAINLEDEKKCQKGDRKEEQLGERKKDGRTGRLMDKMERGKECENVKVGKSPPNSGGTGGLGLQHKDNRSRCGGCINHRETFLLNPQVSRDP